MTREEFLRLRDFLYRKTGLYFDEKKLYFVARRVAERMEATGAGDFRRYFAELRFGPGERELQQLINLLTVNETYFFREYGQLKCFAEEVIPLLVGSRSPPVHLRVWSAGCATGEEAYTLAIILKEMTENQPEKITAQVYATDINTAVLEAARRGCYGARSVREVPPQYLSRYFVREGDSWCVVEPLKEMVHFQHLNLLDRTQMRRMRGFDAIFCRNVLIYFDDVARREVALHFYDALVPGGFIFLGHAESMSRITPVFKLRRFADAIIYQK